MFRRTGLLTATCILTVLFVSFESARAERAPWFEEMEAHFAAFPDKPFERGSGWKPYQRAKWFMELRGGGAAVSPDGMRSAGAALWDAWRVERDSGRDRKAAFGWFAVGPGNLSGRILSVAFHPSSADTVYVGSASGGLWKSTDGGLGYVPLTDDLPSLAIGAVAVDPLAPNTVLIGTGEPTFAFPGLFGVGLFRSTDGGATWSATNLTYPASGTHGFHVIRFNPTFGTALAGANDGLYRSTDGGATWTQIVAGGDWYDVQWKPGDPNRVYAVRGKSGSQRGVFFSDDDGLTWNLAGTGQPSAGNIHQSKLAVTADDPDYVYVHYVNANSFGSLGIYRSTDNGATWSPRNTTTNMTGGQGWYNLSLACDPDDRDRLISGGVSLYESSDGGATWSVTGGGNGLGDATSVHVDHHEAVYETGSNSTLWVGTDGGVWRSTDDGATWSSRREGLYTYQFYDICVAQTDPAFMMGGAQDNGVPGRTGVDTWFTSNLFADGMVCNVDPFDADHVYAESQFGNHVVSYDGGIIWSAINNGITGQGSWVTPVDLDPNDEFHLYTSTSTGVHMTRDGGNQWDPVTAPNNAALSMSISPLDGNFVWMVKSNRARYTKNDGNTWTNSPVWPFASGTPTKILADPVDTLKAYVTFSGYATGAHVAMTDDQGATWTDVTGDLPDIPVNTIAVDPLDNDSWYVGNDLGVYTSTNGGVNWTRYGTALPNVVVLDLEIHQSARKLVAGTHGRGAWEVALASGATEVAEARPNSLNLMLDPPMPNPVGAQTLLRYAARSDGPVRLDVYDIRGRRVETLAEYPRGDGVIRSMYWSADGVASGVYFLILRVPGEELARRVVIAK